MINVEVNKMHMSIRIAIQSSLKECAFDNETLFLDLHFSFSNIGLFHQKIMISAMTDFICTVS